MAAYQCEQASILAESSRETYLNGLTKSLGKGQDFVAFGKKDEYDWAVLLDGHGTNRFINLMREQDWEKIMSSADPWATLLEIVKLYRFQYGRQTGSTLLMMRAYKDRIETLSVGDSQLAIYKNGALVYKSTEHNTDSVAEVIRLKSKSVSINKTKMPIGKVVSASKMIAYYPDYITFSDGTTIAPSQALGQNDVTGYEPEVHTELFTSEDEMRCILFSDGFSDMFLFDSDVEEDKLNDKRDILTLTAAQLVEKAEKRWRGKWNWHWDEKNPDVFLETQFPEDMMDDVGVVVWDNKKAV